MVCSRGAKLLRKGVVNFINGFVFSQAQMSDFEHDIQSKGKTRLRPKHLLPTAIKPFRAFTLLLWTSISTMHDSNDLLQGNDHPICNSDTPLQLPLTLQAMCYLWTQDALDCLMVSLLFVHCLSLLFLSAPAPPFSLPFDCTDVLPPRFEKPWGRVWLNLLSSVNCCILKAMRSSFLLSTTRYDSSKSIRR